MRKSSIAWAVTISCTDNRPTAISSKKQVSRNRVVVEGMPKNVSHPLVHKIVLIDRTAATLDSIQCPQRQ
jgi:hypothetical protein